MSLPLKRVLDKGFAKTASRRAREGGGRVLLVALIYLLLAMEVTVRARLCLNGARGSVQLEAGALGFFFHMDGELSLGPGRPKMKRRYAAPREHRRPRRAVPLRRVRPYLLAAIRAGRVEQARLSLRLGLEDAAQTAMAAGAVRALVLALLAGFGVPLELRVEPDFQSSCVLMAAQGIFSARPGDIMFAMIRVLVRRKRLAGCRKAGCAAGCSPAGTQG